MTLETLRALQTRIREATGPDRELDGDILVAFKGGEIVWKMSNFTMEQCPAHRHPSKQHVGGFANEHVPLLTGSLDACVGLMHATLPGCTWAKDQNGGFSIYYGWLENLDLWRRVWGHKCANDCLTFIDAIISARIAELEAEQKEKANV
jgi:hypothetical protein